MRPALPAAYSAALLSSFVMGAELLLLLVYVRAQILIIAKRRVYAMAEAELLRPGRFVGADPPTRRPSLERLHASVCADSYSSSATLAAACFSAAAAVLLALVMRGPAGPAPPVNAATAVTGGAAALAVFLASQWAFFKGAVLPFYARAYNLAAGADIPLVEADPPGASLLLLAPTLASLLLLAALAAGGRAVSWPRVAACAAVALPSLATEAVSWLVMKGFAVPVDRIAAAFTDAVTAVMWVNRDNPPGAALARLREALFPTGRDTLAAGSIVGLARADNFRPSRLEVADGGRLEVRPAPAPAAWIPALMLVSSLALIAAPVAAAAALAGPLDAAVLLAQMVAIAAAYAVFTLGGGATATMRRIRSDFVPS